MFAAAIACAVLILACGDRRSRSAEAEVAAAPAVTPSNAIPSPSEATPAVSGPVSYERADSASAVGSSNRVRRVGYDRPAALPRQRQEAAVIARKPCEVDR